MAEVTRVTQAGILLTGTGDPSVRVTQFGMVYVAAEPASADAAQSTATVPATGIIGAVTSITVQAVDVNGDAMAAGGETVVVSVTGANTATPTVTDVGDGTYTASYTPTAAGVDSVAVTLGGAAISGSPFGSTVASSVTAVLGSACVSIGINIGL